MSQSFPFALRFVLQPVPQWCDKDLSDEEAVLFRYLEKEYDTHSGRIGGVTMLWEQGAKDSEIRRMGRWTSDCWKVYIRFAKQHCEQLARQIGGSKLRASDIIGETNLPADRRTIKIEDVSTSTRPSN